MAQVAELRARNAAFWDRAAPGWIRHAERQDELGRPLGAAALDRLQPAPGERVLDVGCGCGGTTAELAAAVGPTGAAVGVDLSEAMVTKAQQRFPGPRFLAGVDLSAGIVAQAQQRFARPRPLAGVDLSAGREAQSQQRFPPPRFLAGDIETMGSVPGAPFDAAYSRMTLMLLADPVAGLTTIKRSLRPGGRLAATVFRDGGAVPWLFAAVLGAAPRLGPMPPLPLGDEPGPFAFANPARLVRALTAAGFDAVATEERDVTLDTPDEPEVVAEWLIEIGPAGAAYREAEPEAQKAARAGAVRLLERFWAVGAGYRLPTGLWLVTAEAGS